MKKAPSYIYSIIGISLVLFLLGTIGWLVINGQALSHFFKEQIELQVIFHDNTRPENVQKLEDILNKQPFTRKAEIVTKDEAAKEFSKEWGEDFTELLDFNPLYTSINLKLYSGYVNEDSIAKIKQFIMQSNVVREVTYQGTIIDKMNSTFNKVGLVLGGIALLLFIAVVIIIDNTVRLAMYSNRKLIKTMQLVGAERWFIARPFDTDALISGLVSGLIAGLALLGMRYFAYQQLPELHALSNTLYLIILLACVLVLGILISVLSTHRSVIKYLKTRLEDLY